MVVQLTQLEKTKLGFRPGSAYPKAFAVSGLPSEVHGAGTGRSRVLQGDKVRRLSFSPWAGAEHSDRRAVGNKTCICVSPPVPSRPSSLTPGGKAVGGRSTSWGRTTWSESQRFFPRLCGRGCLTSPL